MGNLLLSEESRLRLQTAYPPGISQGKMVQGRNNTAGSLLQFSAKSNATLKFLKKENRELVPPEELKTSLGTQVAPV
jgi:hypothetical protein